MWPSGAAKSAQTWPPNFIIWGRVQRLENGLVWEGGSLSPSGLLIPGQSWGRGRTWGGRMWILPPPSHQGPGTALHRDSQAGVRGDPSERLVACLQAFRIASAGSVSINTTHLDTPCKCGPPTLLLNDSLSH